jgi:hypothetical protein
MFHIDGDPVSQLGQEPDEDNYSEDATDSMYDPFDGGPDYLIREQEDKHFKMMKCRIEAKPCPPIPAKNYSSAL